MEIKELENKIVEAIKSDKGLLQRFIKAPVKTAEEVLNVDLPDEQVKAALNGAMERLGDIGETIGEAAGGLVDKVKGLFDGK